MSKPRFTVVFEGNVRKLPFNPLKRKDEWGAPVSICIGDVMETEDRLREALVAIAGSLNLSSEALRRIAKSALIDPTPATDRREG